jgi:hypothetical protein
VTLPEGRSRVIVAASDTVLHDSLVDGNELYAPAGSYVFFAASPGAVFRVDDMPAAATTDANEAGP